MTDFFDFAPSQSGVYSFQPTLDGAIYNATVPWLLFGRRFYLSLASQNGPIVWYGAVVGSPSSFPLLSMSWANGRATASAAAPHGYRPATTVQLNVFGCAPAAYNGLVEAFVTGPLTFSYALALDPGTATVLGAASRDVNLIGGVPNEAGAAFASRLVFRQRSQQFEVW